METINLSEIKRLLRRAQIDIEVVLHAMETKILVGEINRPEAPKPKRIYRKKVKDRSPDPNSVRGIPMSDKAIDKPLLPEDKNTFYDAKTVIKGSKRVGIKKDDPPVDTSIEHFDRIKKA